MPFLLLHDFTDFSLLSWLSYLFGFIAGYQYYDFSEVRVCLNDFSLFELFDFIATYEVAKSIT